MIRVTLSDGREYHLAFNHFYGEFYMGKKSEDLVTIPVEGLAKLYPVDEPEMAIEGFYAVHPADNPDKAVGRRIALQRLTDQLENKEDRERVWESYRASGATIR